MKKTCSDELVRLKKVLLSDSLKLPNGFVSVLKNDITAVLNSYFELTDETNISIEINENGVYEITVTARGRNAKKVKSM